MAHGSDNMLSKEMGVHVGKTAVPSESDLNASSGDVEDLSAGSVRSTKEGIKRDLSRRHINMISIAGMIVRPTFRLYLGFDSGD